MTGSFLKAASMEGSRKTCYKLWSGKRHCRA